MTLLTPEIQRIATDALLTHLPTVTAIQERNVPLTDDATPGQVDDWRPIARVVGRLRQARGAREEVVAAQVSPRSDWEFVAAPYPVGTPRDRRILPQDRLIIGGAVYEVTETDDGRTGALLLVVSLIRMADAAPDAPYPTMQRLGR